MSHRHRVCVPLSTYPTALSYSKDFPLNLLNECVCSRFHHDMPETSKRRLRWGYVFPSVSNPIVQELRGMLFPAISASLPSHCTNKRKEANTASVACVVCVWHRSPQLLGADAQGQSSVKLACAVRRLLHVLPGLLVIQLKHLPQSRELLLLPARDTASTHTISANGARR